MTDKVSRALSQFEDIKNIEPDICDATGRRYRNITCRERFDIPLTMRKTESERSEVKTHDVKVSDEDESSYARLVEGLASSTSVDSYGTEMSREALLGMRSQFEKGIPLLPRHNNGMSGAVEWDQVIGRTIRADVERADVVKAAADAEPQYVLRVTSSLYDDDDVARKLMRRLAAGQEIGQSIGGWFLQVRVISNEDDQIERVIVEDVELDHLAITRAPANPDSTGLYALLSKLDGDLQRSREERHVCDVKEDDEHVTVVYKKSMDYGHDHEDGNSHHDEDEKGYSAEQLSEDSSDLEVRDVVKFSSMPIAPEDDEWDWNAASQNEILGPDGDDWGRYRKAHLWYDPENQYVKAGYKLPIARMYGNELRVVFRAVSAAMAALNGARGGVDIPEEDRKGVYDQIVRYYTEFDKEAPELKSKQEADEMIFVEDFVDSIKDKLPELDSTEVELSKDLPLNDSCDNTQEKEEIMVRQDALGSADPANPVINSHEENEMTDSDFEKIQELLSASVGGLAERVKELEAQLSAPEPVEPAPAPVVDEATVALERRLADAEMALAEMASNPVRRGHAHTASIRAGAGATSVIDAVIERARSNGECPTLCAVVERHKDTIAEETGHSKMNARQLRDLLAAGLRAACNDGLIGNSGLNAVWR